ncbi:MAG: FAD-dependent oxidoreductase, partial [Ilumatobacteraceae bacterium]
VRERAQLVGERTVRAGDREWTADTVVLATGSTPVVPPIDGLDEDRIWTSDDLMIATELPESCVLVGGGVIGCESAAILAGFGTRVTLVEGDDELLSGAVDPAVAALLRERLVGLGVDVRTGNDVERIEHHDGDDVVHLAGGDTANAARVLIGVGQAPVWGGLGLDRLGLDDRPEVDEEYVVGSLRWLRAIGDVDGRSPWTHAANHEAARLVELLTAVDVRPEVSGMPNCVFTDPPVAAVGLTALDAEKAGHDVVCGSARYSDIARYATDETFDGMVVVVADRDTGALLGCSGIGPRFDETISVVAALLRGGITVDDAARHIIPFPTMSQVLTPAFQAAADER